jgi:hypothetical protein
MLSNQDDQTDLFQTKNNNINILRLDLSDLPKSSIINVT